MLEQTKRISFRISSVLSKVEPEPDLPTGTGSDQNVPALALQDCRRYIGDLGNTYESGWPSASLKPTVLSLLF